MVHQCARFLKQAVFQNSDLVTLRPKWRSGHQNTSSLQLMLGILDQYFQVEMRIHKRCPWVRRRNSSASLDMRSDLSVKSTMKRSGDSVQRKVHERSSELVAHLLSPRMQSPATKGQIYNSVFDWHWKLSRALIISIYLAGLTVGR